MLELKINFCFLKDINIAFHRPTSQSGTYAHYGSKLAVDGNRDAVFGLESCTHTSGAQLPWWMVQLDHIYHVVKVVITNRDEYSYGIVHHQVE